MALAPDAPKPAAEHDIHAPGELLNLLTHAFGLMLSVIALDRIVVAVLGCANRAIMVACIVYGLSLVAVYAASTLSHSFRRERLRHFLRTLDQVCIFFLIAGTYTPFGVAFYSDGWGSVLLVAMWTLALVGAGIKLFVTGRGNVAVAFYVMLGWLPVLFMREIIARVPRDALVWMAAGGLCYTIGTFFLARDVRYPYFHAVWHLWVIAGSACHYWAILHWVVPLC